MEKLVKAFLLLLLAFGMGVPAYAEDSDETRIDEIVKCKQVIKTHGFLSRAQFQCDFKYYSAEMMQEAKDCAKTLEKGEINKSLRAGMLIFDRDEKERGHTKICGDILQDFPNIVRDH